MKLINNYRINLILATSSAIGVVICQPSYGATLYNITDLGNLGSSKVLEVTDINNLGQVVGFSTITDKPDWLGTTEVRAFRTAPNSPINPTTDNLGALKNLKSLAYGINDVGQVVGSYLNNDMWERAFRTAPNSPINPETDNFQGLDFSQSRAINNSGQVAGIQGLGRGRGFRSFRTAPNNPINLATDDIGSLSDPLHSPGFAIDTQALQINDRGQVVGISRNNLEQRHAFRTAPNSPINPATDDLGTLGGTSSSPSGINNLGQVVGTSANKDGQQRAFRTAPNSPITAADDLGTLGGIFSGANDINNLGQVVGNSTIANGEQRAFLFDEGKMFDLNDLIPTSSGFTLNYANGINDRGQIVAGTSSTNINRIFLLTPIASTSIPEPSSGLGILSVSALFAGFTIKRKLNKPSVS